MTLVNAPPPACRPAAWISARNWTPPCGWRVTPARSSGPSTRFPHRALEGSHRAGDRGGSRRQRLSRQAVGPALPGDGILAEESKDDLSRLGRRRVWIVDPLDGTAEFIAHNGEFVVMIGLVVDGEPVVGVVYQPINDVLYGGRSWSWAPLLKSSGSEPHCRFRP